MFKETEDNLIVDMTEFEIKINYFSFDKLSCGELLTIVLKVTETYEQTFIQKENI